MTYIVMDMEWSQPVCKEKTVYSADGRALPVEIIQIGAVIVKDGMIVPEKFDTYVKPVYYRIIKSKIRKLTGIDENALRGAPTFQKVMNDFRAWSEKYGAGMTVTWGNDDMPMIKAQCDFFGIDMSWMPDCLNLQPIVARQYNVGRPQINLSLAVELVGAEDTLEYHSAINDAYYTALVLQKVKNLSDCIAYQKRLDAVHADPIAKFEFINRGTAAYKNIQELLEASEVKHHVCPLCGKPGSVGARLVKKSRQRYYAVQSCKRHNILIDLKINRRTDNTYVWTKRFTIADKETCGRYRELFPRSVRSSKEKS